jgi:hypothetical protein
MIKSYDFMFVVKKCTALIHLSVILTILMGITSCVGSLGTPAEVTTSGSVGYTHPHLGVWSKCIDYDSNGDSINDKSTKNVLYFTSGSFLKTVTYFDITSCLNTYETHQILTLHKSVFSNNTFTLKLRAYSYTPLSVSKTSSFNTSFWCSMNSWTLNAPRSVLGKNCGGTTKAYDESSTMVGLVSGNTITVSSIVYNLESNLEFNQAGMTLPNGRYVFVNGDESAKMLVIQNRDYTLYHYDLISKYYTIEYGAYSSKNNSSTFNIVSTNPLYCIMGSSSNKFTVADNSLVLNQTDSNPAFIGAKVNLTEEQFRTQLLGGGFGVWCI